MVLLAYLTFAVPHLVFHLGHLHGASAAQAAALVVVLAGSVLLPLALLLAWLVTWMPPPMTAVPTPLRGVLPAWGNLILPTRGGAAR
ncbi:hypothetical protein [Modestobacter marinus]|uniref:hypothetical protein n=1 Tax=Modestobacter marinus TaxID=477641 RepID=UPI001C93FC66|nr:hypothetical protein [Modestobacter marinus]